MLRFAHVFTFYAEISADQGQLDLFMLADGRTDSTSPTMERHKREHLELSDDQVLEAVEKEKFKGGIQLVPKDLREHFVARVSDPEFVMKLFRHPNLQATARISAWSKFACKLRFKNLGASLRCELNESWGHQTTQDDMPPGS